MTETANTTTPATEPAEPSAAATTPTEPAKPTPPPSAPSGNVWDDPTAAKAEIERLRRENGAARTNAKAQAADDARNELAQAIGKALGIVQDEKIDPAELTKQLTESQASTKHAQVELAVFKAAGQAGGDPAALLDSQSFLKSLSDVDPSDSQAVQAAIARAVEANPRLGAASSDPKPPAPNPAQGAGSELSAQAQEDAEYAAFYPPTRK